ncbi:MAG: GNAT family N-acetyltransferase [Muricauda sp.]|nr:GNAT family N-acetyltransferase [Allomuricauda sp.]
MEFDCFRGVSFFRKGNLPLYANMGATNTKSVVYGMNAQCSPNKLGKNVFLVYDVPDYLQFNQQHPKGLQLKSIPQYEGFFCNLTHADTVESYLNTAISKSSRAKLRNYENRLNKEFEVHFKMVWGEISNEEYKLLFDQFHTLLIQRFEEKQIVNNNLAPTEWAFFKEVTLPMLRNKEAGLFVSYIKDKPVAITLLNFSGTHVYDVIRVFDIEFSQYRIGSISIIHQLDWCIRNNFKVLDFSKGYYDYKKSWSTNSYMFHYHIWYNPKNMVSTLIANLLALTFKLKYWARKKHLLKTVHKIRYRMGNKP